MNQPLAFIHPEAKVAGDVTLGPFTNIERDVEIGEGTWIGSNVTIMEGARIGKNCRIFPGAVIAAIPQDLKYNNEYTLVKIGDNTTIREFVTVNKGTIAAGETVIGNNCLLMAYVHVAHDCMIGNNVILANAVNLAGHVIIEDWAIIEGMAGVQQFIRIGAHSFIAGTSIVRKNVPPFVKVAREPLSYVGINAVGLRRRGYSQDKINEINDIYRQIFVKGYNISQALEIIENTMPQSAERDQILAFIMSSDKGIIRGYSGQEDQE